MNIGILREFWSRHKHRIKNIASDLWVSFVEAFLVMAIIHVPLGLRIVWLLIGSEHTLGVEHSFWTAFASNYRTADVLAFSTGLLASSTAYFFVSYQYFKVKPKTMLLLTVFPLILVFAATPVFLRDLDGRLVVAGFASTYVRVVVGIVIFAWLYAIYQQKAIARSSEDDPVRDIMNSVREPK
jgi:hypothetical protein